MTYYLALLETAGNQNYLFSTNKLRENVGASELTYRAGVDWVWAAVFPDWNRAKGNRSMADLLLDKNANRPLEDNPADDAIEILLATSGKALVLSKTREAAKKVVSFVTQKALKEAPGLDLVGVVVECPWATSSLTIHQAIKDAHKELAKQRGNIPGPDERFLRLPVVADCRTSGRAANLYDTEDLTKDEHGPRSTVSATKRLASREGQERMEDMVKRPDGWEMATSLDDLEKKSEWLAVIHADGNGLGEVFKHFDDYAGVSTDREYITKLRHFSFALDEATIEGFKKALAWLQQTIEGKKKPKQKKELPVVPLVLGGDDLSIVCDGRLAVQFVILFLQAFEDATRRRDWPVYGDIIPRVMSKVSGGKISWVTSKAGVAIIKPHYPFHAAYELAEDLMKSAKTICANKPEPTETAIGDEKKEFSEYSAFDYHVLYDASGSELTPIRAELAPTENERLYARPYAVSANYKFKWRTAATLGDRIVAIRKKEDGRHVLPNKMLHELREALFLGREGAEARLDLVRDRYVKQGIGALLAESKSPAEYKMDLFWLSTDEPDDDKKSVKIYRTALLDAMDLADFWTEDKS
jgi:hypothetical protein